MTTRETETLPPTFLERYLSHKEPLLDLMTEHRAAIEAELRRSLAEKVQALREPEPESSGYPGDADSDNYAAWQGFDDAINKAAALIEGTEQSDLRSGSDSASPEPSEET